MRNPEVVLNNLASKSKDLSFTFQRLYRNLYNKEFYLLAYSRLASNQGNMTEGTDGKTIDGMSLERIDHLIESMKNESYQPKPVRRTYIAKANGGFRPLGIPTFEDKLVQEIIRLLLETIYEKSFSDYSHGFRPNKSCHTALIQAQKKFIGAKWFIEGDIEGFFNNIDHHILIQLLRKRTEDEKFIRLIWKFLRAGYMEDWKFHGTYSGTPQGGIVSPILSNIYLNELDQYVEKLIQRFNKGKQRKLNPEYRKYHSRVYRAKKKLASPDLTDDQRNQLRENVKEWDKKKRQIPHSDPMDSRFKRLVYVRYADDFMLGVMGGREDALQIKKELTDFLVSELKLKLSQEKTLITHSARSASFLGFHLRVSRDESQKRNKNGVLVRTYIHKCRLYVPRDKWVNKLKEIKALQIKKDGKWESSHRPVLSALEDIEILNLYNSEIRGMYNYYRIASNVSNLHRYFYFMKFSLYKTFSNKYKTSIKKVISKYSINGNFTVKYETKNGEKYSILYNGGFKRIREPLVRDNMDQYTNLSKITSRTSLVDRLLASQCEWCHRTDLPLEIHHVRKLKDLKGKKNWEKLMLARKRKTMALCVDCHKDLHAGKLD
jgi:group II intron reverse transcriptase/maturase